MQKDDPRGNTTVYRTLKLLTDAGLACEVRFGDNKTYYEHHYNHEHHDHMICTECGKVIEFFSPGDRIDAGRNGGQTWLPLDASQLTNVGCLFGVSKKGKGNTYQRSVRRSREYV